MYVLAVQVSGRDYTDNFFFIYDTASSSLRPVLCLNQLVVLETFFKATNFKKRKNNNDNVKFFAFIPREEVWRL